LPQTAAKPADFDDIDIDIDKTKRKMSIIDKIKQSCQQTVALIASPLPDTSFQEVYRTLGKQSQKTCTSMRSFIHRTSISSTQRIMNIDHNVAVKILTLRGGAGKHLKGVKPVGLVQKLREVFTKVPTINRFYLSLIILCTIAHLIGLPAAELFSLQMNRAYELWRPFTAISYFGAPSISMANSIYFLLRYGQMLEELHGSGAYAFFLTVQMTILTLLAMLLGFPFTAQAMISAIIYVCSRLNAMEAM
jgi:hypothetical protein